jgi:chorismate mutase-like protein
MTTHEGNPEQIPNIDELRQKIDSLDRELLSVLAERMALIPEVAKYKSLNRVPRFQEAREKFVIQNRRAIAEELSINPDLAENILKLIIEDAHRIEKGIIGE